MSHTNGIGNSPLLQTLLGQTDRVGGATRDSALTGKTGATASADKAELSSAGSVLAQAAVSTDDVRTVKVESIRAAIADGSYNVPAGAVADKLIQHLLD